MNNFFKNEIYLETVDSTNTYCKKNNLKDKTIVYSFNQTQGRGRENRKWLDLKNKNLAVSFVLYSNKKNFQPFWYIACCSLALIEILIKKKINSSWIKWPNDIYIDEKKISGVLAETVWSNDKIFKIIIGIGININNTIDDLSSLDNKASSVMIETGRTENIIKFYKSFKNNLSKWLKKLFNSKADMIKNSWKKYSINTIKKILWISGKNKIEGFIEDIKDDGTLIIKSDSDSINYEIKTGEIKIL